jgi:Domain of unknown function (DUF1707)
VATGPGDKMAAGATGRGHLRASDADRDQVIDTLKDAFVQGRLTMDELDLRAGQTLLSRTYAELTLITADIPAGLIGVQPPPTPAWAPTRKPMNKQVVAWCASVIILPAALASAFLTYYGGFFVLILFAFIGFTVTAPGAGGKASPGRSMCRRS